MTDSEAFQFIKLEIDTDKVARLTLTRAEKHNAFNEHVIAELSTALDIVAKQARILVLQAEGKSFSAGADLDWMQRMASFDFAQNVQDANGLAVMLNRLHCLRIPSIAKVQGGAYGGGVGLVACCDIVVASDQARFCLSEVKLGLVPATISPYVIDALGAKVARRLFISAEVFNAEQAQQWNLVSEVVATENLDDVVQQWIRKLQNNSPAAIAAAKALVDEVAGRSITEEIMQITSRRIAEARASEQGKEGVQAFLEKRAPSWK